MHQTLFVWKFFFSLSDFWREFRIILLAFGLNIEFHLLDPQSVFTWSKILMAVPQRSGLESLGHKVTVGKTILSIGKVSTTDFMGFSIQPASTNLIFNFWFLISMLCPMAYKGLKSPQVNVINFELNGLNASMWVPWSPSESKKLKFMIEVFKFIR